MTRVDANQSEIEKGEQSEPYTHNNRQMTKKSFPPCTIRTQEHEQHATPR